MLLTVITLLTVVQSVFEVGLLFFGTPLLLLLGYPYLELLYIPLPASLTLSILQLRFDHTGRCRELIGPAMWAVPGVAAGTAPSLLILGTIDIRYPVAEVLAVVAVMRLNAGARQRLRHVCVKAGQPALTGIALIHGLTNMGGGLLANGLSVPNPRLLAPAAGVVIADALLGRRTYRGVLNNRYQIYFSAFMLAGASIFFWQAT